MVNLLAPPFWTPVDGNGNIYAGAKAYFYRTGTSTPQDTWADFALNTLNANPVVADSNGAFAPIYLSADYDYKVEFTTSTGAIIKTIDPYPLQSFQTTVVLNGSELDVMPFAPPQGRLTLSTGVPVPIANVAAAATVYYSPYAGNLVPIWDGLNLVPTTFAELSNILTNSATGKAGPEVAGPYQNIDLLVWNDADTIRLTRAPKWTKSATVTITIATPGVVTWASHGLYDGATMRFTTTGALPTGLAAATDYFVTVVDANSFKLSSTLANQIAGTFINTSVGQSGVHTGYNFTTARGTGAATAELERVNGLLVNKYDITNGPLARKGTYVGTIYCDSASQANWNTGGLAAGGTEAQLHVWNAYNRVVVEGMVGDTTDNWNYTTATWRPARAVATMRASFVQGLQEDAMWAEYRAGAANGGGGNSLISAIGYETTALPATGSRFSAISSPAASYLTMPTGDHSVQALGFRALVALEYSAASSTTTWYGDNGGSLIQSGLRYRGRF